MRHVTTLVRLVAIAAAMVGAAGCAADNELDAEPDRVINERQQEPELLPSVGPSDPSSPGDPNRGGVLD